MGEAFMPRRGGGPRQLWRSPIGSLGVGTVVRLNVNGVPLEFIIVNQGSPEGYSYGNGTWLLMKDVLDFTIDDVNYKKFGLVSDNRYGNFSCYWYYFTNNTYSDYSKWNYDISNLNTASAHLYNFLDDDIKECILTASIPVTMRDSDAGYIYDSWFSAKVFALSHMEVGFGEITISDDIIVKEGGILEYFKGASSSGTLAHGDRIAYGNGSACEWWLRTPQIEYAYPEGYGVYTDGALRGSANSNDFKAFRPALILSPDTHVDRNNNVIGR